MRVPLAVFPAVAVILLAWLLFQLDGAATLPRSRAPAPAAATTGPEGADVAVAAPRTPAPDAGESADRFVQVSEAPAGDPAYRPVTIQLDAPPEWREGIPVEIVWSADAVTGRAAVSGFRTDAEGRARCRFKAPVRRPQWFCADLAIPTMGMSSAPIPDAGGEVNVSMVLPAWLDVEVVEGAGPPSEDVLLEVRAPGARAPGDRWHRHRVQDGRARLMVEAGIDLEVRASTPSGQSSGGRLRTPAEPGASAPCRLELDVGGGVRIVVRMPDTRPLVDHGVQVIRRDRWQPLAACRTDDRGELLVRLPRTLLQLARADLQLHADVDGAPHYAELVLDAALLRDGGLAEATLLPAPRLVAGTIVDSSGAGNRGAPVELQLGLEDAKARPDGGRAWRTIASAVAAADGAFAIAAFAPRGAPLRLRLPEAQSLAPIAVEPGAFDLRIVAPVRRTAFGSRRR